MALSPAAGLPAWAARPLVVTRAHSTPRSATIIWFSVWAPRIRMSGRTCPARRRKAMPCGPRFSSSATKVKARVPRAGPPRRAISSASHSCTAIEPLQLPAPRP